MMLSNAWNTSMSTESLHGMETQSAYSLPLFKFSKNLFYFGPPVILLFGNFGNVMTIIIMHSMKSGEAVINIYFTALAVIDLVSLDIHLLGTWGIEAFGYDIRDEDNAVCKIYNWITTSTGTMGGWYLVGLTTHRAVSVVWPHRVNLLCTWRLVIGLIWGIVAFFAVVYSHYMYGFSLHYRNTFPTCLLMSGSYQTFVDEVFSYIDLVLYSLLPFTCIFSANCVLVWKLRASVREIRQKFGEKGSEQVTAREKATSSVTWTVILVSVAYVVLTLPVAVCFNSLFSSLFLSADNTLGGISAYERAKIEFFYTITFLLMFSNSAVNFYLYCLTGERFRKKFMMLLCPARSDGASLRSASSASLPIRLPSTSDVNTGM